jgi:hypothetical protein
VVTVPASTIAASGAAVVFPPDPTISTVTASEDAVLDVVFVGVDVVVVQFLSYLGAVVACWWVLVSMVGSMRE